MQLKFIISKSNFSKLLFVLSNELNSSKEIEFMKVTDAGCLNYCSYEVEIWSENVELIQIIIEELKNEE